MSKDCFTATAIKFSRRNKDWQSIVNLNPSSYNWEELRCKILRPQIASMNLAFLEFSRPNLSSSKPFLLLAEKLRHEGKKDQARLDSNLSRFFLLHLQCFFSFLQMRSSKMLGWVLSTNIWSACGAGFVIQTIAAEIPIAK